MKTSKDFPSLDELISDNQNWAPKFYDEFLHATAPVSTRHVNFTDYYSARWTPDSVPLSQAKSTVWTFGGSTMENQETTDSLTIANTWAKIFNHMLGPTHVKNFGTSGFVTSYELIKFTKLLREVPVNELIVAIAARVAVAAALVQPSGIDLFFANLNAYTISVGAGSSIDDFRPLLRLLRRGAVLTYGSNWILLALYTSTLLAWVAAIRLVWKVKSAHIRADFAACCGRCKRSRLVYSPANAYVRSRGFYGADSNRAHLARLGGIALAAPAALT